MNSNYGYQPPSGGYEPPYNSTPSDTAARRPRFGYSGPPSYPRPRSSASKPNPSPYNSYSDSMSNNYGSTYSGMDDSYSSDMGSTYNNSISKYYSASESFYPNTADTPQENYYSQPSGVIPPADKSVSLQPGYTENFPSPMYPSGRVQNYGQNKFPYSAPSFTTGANAVTVGGRPFNRGGFQNKNRNFPANKPKMANQGFTLKCQICNLDFTSQIPYDMHLRGARHAKKVKATQVSPIIQAQAGTGINGEQTFYCSICDVKANSPLQYQMHLTGTKHKNKLNPPADTPAETTPTGATPAGATTPAANSSQVLGKRKNKATPTTAVAPTTGVQANGSAAPTNVDSKTKLLKTFSCDICNLTVNSETQLQQHLVSKKHQFKVEGKPLPKKPRKQKAENADTDTTMTDVTDQSSAAMTTTKPEVVMGVKTLSSSFVKGGLIL